MPHGSFRATLRRIYSSCAATARCQWSRARRSLRKKLKTRLATFAQKVGKSLGDALPVKNQHSYVSSNGAGNTVKGANRLEFSRLSKFPDWLNAGSHTWTNGFILMTSGSQTLSGDIYDATGINGSANVIVSP
jgi:hypothetical protein